jgi:hypothetical protein
MTCEEVQTSKPQRGWVACNLKTGLLSVPEIPENFRRARVAKGN